MPRRASYVPDRLEDPAHRRSTSGHEVAASWTTAGQVNPPVADRLLELSRDRDAVQVT
jgi:hypothetical protein